MRFRFLLTLFLISAALPAGAASDKDRISGLERRMDVLDHKQDRLLQLEAGHYNDLVRILRDLKKNSEMVMVQAPVVATPPAGTAPLESMPAAAPAVVSPAEVPSPAPEATAPTVLAAENTATLPAPVVTPETAATAATIAAPVVVQAPEGIAPAAPVADQNSKEIKSRMSRLESLTTLSFVVTAISLVAMVLMFKNLRQKEQTLKTAIWRSDMQGLREEVMLGRPHISVEKNFERLTLLNKGSIAANDVQLALGPAPGAMKQKVRSVPTIRPGEKADVEITGYTFEGQIYGGLEYKNAQTGRLYKDQFLMKIDGVTGEIVPIKEAI